MDFDDVGHQAKNKALSRDIELCARNALMQKLPLSSLARICMFFSLFTLQILSFASESDIERKWDGCAESALKHYDHDKGGVTGGNFTIIEKCGLRPLIKTDRGFRLLTSDCDWLHRQPLRECANQENKEWCKQGEDMLVVSMSSWRGFWSLSNQAFNQDNFFKLCREVCLGKSTPDKKQFENSYCRSQ